MTSIFIHQPRLRFSSGEKDSTAVFPATGTPDVSLLIAVGDRERSFRVDVTLRFVIAIASNRTWKMPSRAIAFTHHWDLRALLGLAIGERFGFAWRHTSDKLVN